MLDVAMGMPILQRLRDRINPPKSEREKRLGRPKPLILAQNLQHAHLVGEYLGLHPYEYEYVGSAIRMHGHRDCTIYVYDTLEWRNDSNSIIELLDAATAVGGANVVIITEKMLRGIERP